MAERDVEFMVDTRDVEDPRCPECKLIQIECPPLTNGSFKEMEKMRSDQQAVFTDQGDNPG